MSEKCDWKHTPNLTPYTHPRTRQTMPGFLDEWTIGCVPKGTLRVAPKLIWVHCPYCGREINWLSEPSLPQEAPKAL
jgi:hypothetical protein